MNKRVLQLVGRVNRRSNALLATMWDYCRMGIEKTVRFQGIVYRIINVAGQLMIRIQSEGSADLLGLVRNGEIFQCA